MQQAAHDAGRDMPRWTTHAISGAGSTAPPPRRVHVAQAIEAFYGLPYARFEKWSPAGPPTQLADFLAPYVVAGCSMFNLILNGRSADAEIEAAAEIRNILHAAPS